MFPESSNNVGIVKFTADEGGKITVFPRTSINSQIDYIDLQLHGLCRMTGFCYSGKIA
jgi:hypothetical protein